MLAEVRTRGTKIYDGEVAIALRAIERGARDTQKQAVGETAYISLIGRLLHVRSRPATEEAAKPASSLILP